MEVYIALYVIWGYNRSIASQRDSARRPRRLRSGSTAERVGGRDHASRPRRFRPVEALRPRTLRVAELAAKKRGLGIIALVPSFSLRSRAGARPQGFSPALVGSPL